MWRQFRQKSEGELQKLAVWKKLGKEDYMGGCGGVRDDQVFILLHRSRDWEKKVENSAPKGIFFRAVGVDFGK